MERELQEEIMMRRDKEVRDIREERLFQVRISGRRGSSRSGYQGREALPGQDIREERLFQVRISGRRGSSRSGHYHSSSQGVYR